MTTGKAGSTRCGTMSGYNAHYKHGEKPCETCRAHATDWSRAKYLRAKSGYRLSMADALTQLGLPADRVPAQVTS
jgi:hypothetical protein